MALMDPELEKKVRQTDPTAPVKDPVMQTTSEPAAPEAVEKASTYSPTGLGVGSTPAPDNVADVASGMMSQDSLLMKKARAQGEQFANRRGLQNSSIAGQAAQSAVLDQIVPMASQTAQQRHSKTLQAREQEFQGSESEKDRDLRLDIVEREEQLQRDKMAQEVSEAALDRDLKIALEEMKVNAEDKRGVDSILSNVFRDYEESQRSILNNPDLPADERNDLLENARNMLNAKVDYISSLYSTSFNWPENPFQPAAEPEEPSGGGTDSGGGGNDYVVTSLDQSR